MKDQLYHQAILDLAKQAGRGAPLEGAQASATVDNPLAILRELRKDFPETGAVLQSSLHRTEADCRALAHEGSRVRLCKGAYLEPPEVAYQDAAQVDASFERSMEWLLAPGTYPRIPTHACALLDQAERTRIRPGLFDHITNETNR